MTLDLDPAIVTGLKVCAAIIAVAVFWFSPPPGLSGLMRRILPRAGGKVSTSCQTIDTCWRTLIDSSIEIDDAEGVDLLNKWIAHYTIQQLESRS